LQGGIERPGDDQSERSRRFVAKASIVFNVAQVSGAPPTPVPHTRFDPIEAADALIAATGIPVEHAGHQPCYIPSRDLVRLPAPSLFVSPHAYYGTAFHELTHATGHKSRLNRDLSGRFGDAAYAMEELVAEISSAFVMAGLGLSPEPHPGSIAYLASWLKVFRADKRAIFIAASAASKAADYLTSGSSQSHASAASSTAADGDRVSAAA
jgi:antirestriction protein ArdC